MRTNSPWQGGGPVVDDMLAELAGLEWAPTREELAMLDRAGVTVDDLLDGMDSLEQRHRVVPFGSEWGYVRAVAWRAALKRAVRQNGGRWAPARTE